MNEIIYSDGYAENVHGRTTDYNFRFYTDSKDITLVYKDEVNGREYEEDLYCLFYLKIDRNVIINDKKTYEKFDKCLITQIVNGRYNPHHIPHSKVYDVSIQIIDNSNFIVDAVNEKRGLLVSELSEFRLN